MNSLVRLTINDSDPIFSPARNVMSSTEKEGLASNVISERFVSPMFATLCFPLSNQV
jgi:hypothetical protein